jgi:hypothetical protein
MPRRSSDTGMRFTNLFSFLSWVVRRAPRLAPSGRAEVRSRQDSWISRNRRNFRQPINMALSRARSMRSCIACMTSSWVYDLALGSSASRRASSTSRVIRAYSSGHSACSMRSDACPSRCSRPNSRMSLVATTCSRIRSWITSQARCASGVAVPS